jgi:hypothetical protein
MVILTQTGRSVMRGLSPVLSVYKRMNVHSLLALAGMAGPIVLGATDISAALSTPTYNLIRDSISSLAMTSLGWVQTIGFLAIGLLIEIFTAGLLYNVRRARGFHLGIALLVLFGLSVLSVPTPSASSALSKARSTVWPPPRLSGFFPPPSWPFRPASEATPTGRAFSGTRLSPASWPSR